MSYDTTVSCGSCHFAVPVNNRFSSLTVEFVPLESEDADPHEVVMDSVGSNALCNIITSFCGT